MTHRQIALWVLTFATLFCSFGLLALGALIMPDNLPVNELSSWTHPGTLTMLSGLLGFVMSAIPLTLANKE